MKSITIAVDAMGGDFGPSVAVPGACLALKKFPHCHIILTGDEKLITQNLLNNTDSSRLSIQHTTETIPMDMSPSKAIRLRDSAMRVAANLVKSGDAQGMVSAGNTGALMLTTQLVIKTLPNISRVAISTKLPTKSGKGVRMLDLGANVDSTPENLFQFAVMGSLVSQYVDNIESPKIGLLNIGEEEIKGNELIKATSELLENFNIKNKINYMGFIESNKIFDDCVDVVVCDGFVGNVLLKTTEGTAKLMGDFIKSEFNKNILTQLIGLLSKPILNKLKNKMDPDLYNGASFLGANHIVIKSHGHTTPIGFANAISEALHQIEHDVPNKISHLIGDALDEQ